MMMSNSKPRLEPEEVLKVAYEYIIVGGIDQFELANKYGVSNQGRVNEAIKGMRFAMHNIRLINKLRKRMKQIGRNKP